MLILTNCLSDEADEGCIKVASSLVKRIKHADPNVTVVSFERRSELADVYLELNKLLLSVELMQLLHQHDEEVLYIPFPSKPTSTAIRMMMLTLMAGKQVRVLLSMTVDYGPLARWLLKMSQAHVYSLSMEATDLYAEMIGPERVTYLKTGVDTSRFTPVTSEQKRQLRLKYGLDPDKKMILHVGHMKEGRNIGQLTKLDQEYQIVLVVSRLTKDEADSTTRELLEKCPNIRIIDKFVRDIQELYQAADVYFFPVTDKGNCIDIPLSAMEAAACGLPVITTEYGEMQAFAGKAGFFFIHSFDANELNNFISQAICSGDVSSRNAVLDYDWHNAVSILRGLPAKQSEEVLL